MFCFECLKFKILHFHYDSFFFYKAFKELFVTIRFIETDNDFKALIPFFRAKVSLRWYYFLALWYYLMTHFGWRHNQPIHSLDRFNVTWGCIEKLYMISCIEIYDYSVVLKSNVCCIDRCSCGNPWVEQ